jgi:hypothetical protein
MEYDVPFKGPGGSCPSHPSRCLLHLVVKTLEAPPNLALIELSIEAGPMVAGQFEKIP